MKFENKGKWLNQIQESLQKNEDTMSAEDFNWLKQEFGKELSKLGFKQVEKSYNKPYSEIEYRKGIVSAYLLFEPYSKKITSYYESPYLGERSLSTFSATNDKQKALLLLKLAIDKKLVNLKTESAQKNEDEPMQLNLFKDKIAEQTERDYKQFIYGYPNRLTDYLNKAYTAIVKNMPATDAQKKARPCKIADFTIVKSNDGIVQTGLKCKLDKDLHALSLDQAINNANKANINKYKGKQFASIAKEGSMLIIKVDKSIIDEVTKAIKANK